MSSMTAPTEMTEHGTDIDPSILERHSTPISGDFALRTPCWPCRTFLEQSLTLLPNCPFLSLLRGLDLHYGVMHYLLSLTDFPPNKFHISSAFLTSASCGTHSNNLVCSKCSISSLYSKATKINKYHYYLNFTWECFCTVFCRSSFHSSTSVESLVNRILSIPV